VLLPDQSLKQWATTHGRALNEAEQYGAVKMHLFQAFDEIEDMMTQGRRLLVTTDVLQNVLATLNVQ
jgi:urease gamma subunit